MDSSTLYLELAFDLPVDRTFFYTCPEDDAAPVVGCRVRAPFSGRTLTGYVVAAGTAMPRLPRKNITLKPIERVLDKAPLFGSTTLPLARWLADFYFCTLGQALATMLPRGIRPVEPQQLPGQDTFLPLLTPNQEQQQAIAALEQVVRANQGGRCLLQGVTGSGKTEVYRHTARAALQAGLGVIMLVPEIALTPRLVSLFGSLLPGRIALLHSRLTPSQRLHEWRRILSGAADVVIGARSAVFAPLDRPCLIIIDEEQEQSYKSGECPRYHARQVAFHRTAAQGCLLLGSATPSLETLHHAERSGMLHLNLQQRISPHPAPEILPIDMAEEGEGALLSRALLKELKQACGNGRQALLFLNRRGFSPFLICRDCDQAVTCPHCSISLSLHRKQGLLRCHYCGYALPFHDACPHCGSSRIRICGAGTERVEGFLEKRFPGLRIARLDSDAVSNRTVLFDLLQDFRSGAIDILVGTQMIAKGLDFPDVTLVGVLAADAEVHFPDFRSYERSFNQLLQVIGRCGRADKKGKAFVQTLLPDADPIRSALTGDHAGFHTRELARRQELGYPPFTRLVRLVARHPQAAGAKTMLEEVAAELQAARPDGCSLLGPAPCPLERISGNYRQHLLLRSHSLQALRGWLRALSLREGPRGKGYLELDIDPLNML